MLTYGYQNTIGLPALTVRAPHTIEGEAISKQVFFINEPDAERHRQMLMLQRSGKLVSIQKWPFLRSLNVNLRDILCDVPVLGKGRQ